jgi:NitT/TauT family transport system substrate-binding protein
MTTKVRAVLALVAALAAPTCASAQSTPVSLRIGVIPSDFAAEAYYAKDLGLFQKAGLNVEITPMNSGSAIASAVVSGALDVGYSNVVSLAIAHDRGIHVTIIAPANLSDSKQPTVGTLAVAKSSSIRSAKDLNGKTIGVNALNDIAGLGTRMWIDANGGDSTSVRFVEIPFSEMPEAVRTGRVDAASMNQTVDPNLGKPGDPLRLLANAFDAISPHFASSAWFSSSDWVSKHPAETAKFLTVMRETATWANAHHRESAAILAKYIRKTADEIEGVTRVPYSTTLTPQLLQPSIDLAARYKVIRKPFAAKDFLDPRIL